MEELILVTILPAMLILTAFLFNVGTKEIIDFKYGLNTYYFKPIAGIISFLYLLGLFVGTTIVKFAGSKKEANPYNVIIFVIILVLSTIYCFIYSKFNKKRGEIIIGRSSANIFDKTHSKDQHR